MNTNPNVHEAMEQRGRRTLNLRGPKTRGARNRLTICLLGVVFLGAQLAYAANEVPRGINYQGKLSNNLGQPVASDYYQVNFKIWSHQTRTNDSDYIWGGSYAVHVVSDGSFNVMLDDTGARVGTPQKTNVLEAFEDPNRWLGLTITKVGGTTVSPAVEISPRQQLVSAPYAIHAYTSKSAVYASEAATATYSVKAGNATTFGDLTTNDFVRSAKASQAITGDLYVSGKLGVGRASGAVSRLDIQGGATATGEGETLGSMAFGYFADGGYRHFLRTRHNAAGAVAGNAIDFFLNTGTTSGASTGPGTNNALALTLDNGKVGIGTSSPDRPLTIKPNGTDWIGLLSTNSTPTTKWHINNVGNGVNFAETGVADTRLYLQPSGNVGIGTTAPAGKLDVNGSIKVSGAAPIVMRSYPLPNIAANGGDSSVVTTYSTAVWSAAVIGWQCKADVGAGSQGWYRARAATNASGNWEIQFKFHNQGPVEGIIIDTMFIRKELVQDLR